MANKLKIALVGNPNCGKTSLFNALTGLRQKVANYPGVTVDKKTGYCQLNENIIAEIVDLPGTYSLYPRSMDEYVAFDVLLNPENESYPDLIIVLADASNLKRNLLFCSQIIDLKIPVIVALNMLDVAKEQGLFIQIKKLSDELGVKIIPINARKSEGVDELKKHILQQQSVSKNYFIDVTSLQPSVIDNIKKNTKIKSDYAALLTAHHYINIYCLDAAAKEQTKKMLLANQFNSSKLQGEETLMRYEKINQLIHNCVKAAHEKEEWHESKLDKVLTHPLWGYLFFLVLMYFMFQLIFSVAQYPMDLIDGGVQWLNDYLKTALPDNTLTSLLTDGIIAGLGGIVIFIPQIMLLFAMITLLEDSGYMARVSFMMDKLMRKVGMNGRSVVPLMSGMACAVPAIMSARTIENKRDRLITILVTPLMSCSARLPVYVLLVGMAVPQKSFYGIISLQALAMLLLYMLGFIAAIVVALVLTAVMKKKERSYFIMELPIYRMPRWSNVIITMWEKAKIFTLNAGKIIMAIAVVLWFLASFGPSQSMDDIRTQKANELTLHPEKANEIESLYQSKKLENSYAGHLGKFIEPAIKPLGYDWKIGIALITSFAAREVFVGTMSTLYSVGNNDTENKKTLQQKMMSEKHSDTGFPVFSIAAVFSLLIFYAFAMQCMSTIAVVYRESGSWKWAAVQIVYMTALAYASSFAVYHLLS
ncbi:MAG: ferrous iron transport protein [Bacteroidota bacterium]